MPTATISIVVPDLPDADVWFANNAAWSNYWNNISGEVTLDPATTTIYIPVAYDDSLVAVAFNIDGIDYLVVSQLQFNSLLAKVNAIDTAFQNLRTELKDAGFIDNAQ